MTIQTKVERPVVAAVAGMGWAPQPAAVLWAAAEAARRATTLVLVHGFATLAYESGPAEHELLRVAAQAELDDALRLARRERPALPVTARLTQDRPDLVLLEESTRAALVVLGTRAHAVEATETRYGSMVGALLTAAVCPVVAVPPAPARRLDPRPALPPPDTASTGTVVHAAPPANPVVVAADGSAVSQPAVRFAFDAAARRGAPLTVVHCWPDGAGQAAARRAHRVLLAEVLAGFAERYPEVTVTDGGCAGDPIAALVRWSRRAALLVLGTHGRDRWASAVWGSVSRTLVREAACPVAVVRPLAASGCG